MKFLIFIDSESRQFAISEVIIDGKWIFDTLKSNEFHLESVSND